MFSLQSTQNGRWAEEVNIEDKTEALAAYQTALTAAEQTGERVQLVYFPTV